MRIILLLLCILFSPALGFAQPSIAFDQESQDVGKVTAGVPIEHVFEVRNTGDEDLIISSLIPS